MIKTELRFITNTSSPVSLYGMEGLDSIKGGVYNPSFQYYSFGWSGDTISMGGNYPSLYNDGTVQHIPLIQGWSWIDGWMVSQTGSTEQIYQPLDGINAGEYYKVTFNVKDVPNGESITPILFGNSGTTVTSDGQYTQIISIDVVSGNTISFLPSLNFTGGISNINVSATNSKYQSIDLYDDEAINLTFQIQTDISNKAAAYSKTLKVPGTQNNNYIFNSLFEESVFISLSDIYSGGTIFLNRKIPAGIFCDSVELVTGYFEVTRVDVNDKKIEYEGTFYSNVKSIADVIGDYEITGNEDPTKDIDFSQYNHTFNFDSISGSWPTTAPTWNGSTYYVQGTKVSYNSVVYICINSCNNLIPPNYPAFWKRINFYNDGVGYYYPMIDYANVTSGNEYRIEQFKPSIYIKELWDKIFSKAGYSYTSNFLASSLFKNLVIPQGNTRKTATFFLENTKFDVGLTNNQDIGYYLSKTGSNVWTTPATQVNYDKTDGVFSNPNGTYSVGLHLWQNTGGTGTYDFTSTVQYSIQYTTLDGTQWCYGVNTNSHINVTLNIVRQRNGVNYTIGSYVDAVYPINNNWPSGAWFVPSRSFTISALSQTCLHNDKYFVNVLYAGAPFYAYKTGSQNTTQNPGNMNFRMNNYYTSGITYNEFKLTPTNDPTNYYSDGNIVYVNDCLPDKMKQLEFLTSVSNKFSLMFTEDKSNTNNLIIEPYDNFYYTGNTYLDWGNKIDLSKEKWIDRIPYLVDLDLSFPLNNDDNDLELKYYHDATKTNFGSKLVKNPYYSTDVSVVDDKFSSTMLEYYGSTHLITSRIYGQQDTYNGMPTDVDYNTRFLYRNFITTGNTTGFTFEQINISTLATGATTGTTVIGSFSGCYPYAGFMDSPYYPTLDLNYGIARYYHTNFLTSNNLAWVYWRNKISQYMNPNSKMITIYLRLTPTDIALLDFRQKIILYNKVYKLNKIIEWTPNGNSCKVELIQDSVLDVNAYLTNTVWTPGSGGGSVSGGVGDVISDSIILSPPNSMQIFDGLPTGVITDANYFSGYTWIDENNYVAPNSNSLVIGKGNIINGSNSIIQGNFNTVLSDNVLLFNSSNNYIETGLTNVVLIGVNDQTITENNTVYINNISNKVTWVTETGYTLSYIDANTTIVYNSDTDSIYFWIPEIDSALPIGTKVTFIQYGVGQILWSWDTVTVISLNNNSATAGQGAQVTLEKIDTTSYCLYGDLAAI